MARDDILQSDFTRDSLPPSSGALMPTPTPTPTATPDASLPQSFNFLQGTTPQYGAPAEKALPEYASAERRTITDEAAAATKRLNAIYDQQSSVLPTILTIAAALKGDFRPAFQLQEQKRVTKLGMAVIPEVARARSLAAEGHTKEAQDILNTLVTGLSGRAPEMAQMVSKTSDLITQKVQAAQAHKGLIQFSESQVKDNPELEKSRRPIIEHLKGLDKAGIPLDKETINQMYQGLRFETQIVEDQQITKDNLTGRTWARPLDQVMKQGSLAGIAGNMLQEAHGLNQFEATNVLNDRLVTTAYGTTIAPGSPEARTVKKDWVALSGVRQAEEGAKFIQLPPEEQLQLLKNGTHPVNIALRNISPQAASAALTGVAGRRVELAKAPIIAGLEEDPTRMAGANQVLVDLTPNARDFGTNRELEARTFADFKRLRAEGKQLGYVNREVYNRVMAPGVQGLRDLQAATDMLESIKNPDGVFEQAASGITQQVAQRVGYAIQPGMTYRQVARILMERGVNQGSIGQTDSQLVRDVVAFTTGPMLTAKDMKEVRDSIGVFQRRILDNIRTNTGATMSVEDFQKTYTQPQTPAQLKAPQPETKGAKGLAAPGKAAVQKKIQDLREQGVPIPEKGEYQGQGVMKNGRPVHKSVPGAGELPQDLGVR
jgi:hypothetical protein